MLRSGEWGSTVRLGVGTSLLWARDRGEGLIEGRELWWVSLGVGSKTQRLGGWPVKLQLSRSCAAACPGGGCSAGAACFPGDETRRERSEIDNKNPRRNESRRAVVSPPRRGKVADADTGFAVCPWECTRQWSMYVCTACWMGSFPVESGVKSRASR